MNNSQTRAVRQPGGGARGDGRVSSRRSDGALRVLLVCALATLGACGPGGERERVVGEAWVGPSMVQIRKELNLRSPVSGTLQHDERVDLIARRRRFVKEC
jgi:hypothetical protein